MKWKSQLFLAESLLLFTLCKRGVCRELPSMEGASHENLGLLRKDYSAGIRLVWVAIHLQLPFS